MTFVSVKNTFIHVDDDAEDSPGPASTLRRPRRTHSSPDVLGRLGFGNDDGTDSDADVAVYNTQSEKVAAKEPAPLRLEHRSSNALPTLLTAGERSPNRTEDGRSMPFMGLALPLHNRRATSSGQAVPAGKQAVPEKGDDYCSKPFGFSRSVTDSTTATQPKSIAWSTSSGSHEVTVKNTFVHLEDVNDIPVISHSHSSPDVLSRSPPDSVYADSDGQGSPAQLLQTADAHAEFDELDDDDDDDDLSEYAFERLPSVGSVAHTEGRCKPCAWFWKAQGCKNGSDCRHCHACPMDEIRNRKKNRNISLRIARRAKRLAKAEHGEHGRQPHARQQTAPAVMVSTASSSSNSKRGDALMPRMRTH
eukprot:TRINITY_DN103259_c0_g1_i1.p1 TRINITY_DN103259_c0_g1~~TRINITY_DN103259_c0_g1_i1.p1  ORF type:complete len:419 (-),score=66.45 TRINITY_DN103259_c0_g1_i1:244-1329(-)